MAADILELKRAVDVLTQRVNQLEARQSPALPRPLAISSSQQKSLEHWLAGYWFARFGIISLVTGVAFFVADSYAWLGAPLKVLLGYGIAGAFVLTSRYLARKQAALSRILVAGGLGVAYYTTYAMHYVPSTQLISSPVLASLLLAIMVIVIIAVAHRMRSETVAGVALFLGLHTGMVSAIGSFTLLSSVLLAAGAAFFLAKNRWVYVPISTLLAVYCTHLLWILGNPMIAASSSHELSHFETSISFAVLYFATFSIALVLAAQDLHKRAAVLFAFLNWAAFVLILGFEYDFHGQAGLPLALAALAASTAIMALLSARLRPQGIVAEILLVLCACTVALAAWSAADGSQLVLAWCAASLVACLAAAQLRMSQLARVGSAILCLAYLAQLSQLDRHGLALVLALTTVAHERLHHIMERRSGEASELRLAPPVALACLALATTIAPHYAVIFWMASALALLLIGALLSEFGYRIAAIGLLVISFARLFIVDMATLSSIYRIAAFLALGLGLLAISYVYSANAAKREGDRN